MVTRDRPWMYIVHTSAAGEGAGFWRSVRAELTDRGVRDIWITRCDSLAGLEDAIASAFRRTFSRCVVHDAGLPVMPTSRRELVAAVLRVAKGRHKSRWPGRHSPFRFCGRVRWR